MEARSDPRGRARDPSGSARPFSLRAGDGVRLKFMYPGPAVEIVDCTWIGVVGIGAAGSETTSPWVCLEFQGRRMWKPLEYLVQVELVEEGPEPTMPTPAVLGRAHEDLGYHR